MLWDNLSPLLKNKPNIENNAKKSKVMSVNTSSSPLLKEYAHLKRKCFQHVLDLPGVMC